jgi:Na+-transporting methylmalonyl-CoA/oxaloacetate decarboxylase gamma subunit
MGEPVVEGEAAADIENLQPIAFALRLTGLGMGVVFVALLVLSGLLAVAQRAYKPSEEPAAGAAAAPQQQAAPSQPTSSGIAPEVMAAISAAVAITTQKRFRIKRIRYREAPPLGVWSRQGRITIMTSRRGKNQK